jgi:hypothetical protein
MCADQTWTKASDRLMISQPGLLAATASELSAWLLTTIVDHHDIRLQPIKRVTGKVNFPGEPQRRR